MDLEYFRNFSSLKVNRCLYFILIFAHYQIMLIFYVLKEINMNFDITALTKSRIKNNSASPINIELKS